MESQYNVLKHIGSHVINQAKLTLQRLRLELDHKQLQNLTILLPFGGGKDSTWTLAYVRVMQLLLHQEIGTTFQLTILVMLHPGVPDSVFKNIYRVFESLYIRDHNISVRATALGGEEIELNEGTIGEHVRRKIREEILFCGHLSQGNGRETFCNGCNFALMNAISRYVVVHDVDVVITGDSDLEIVSYWRWVNSTARLFDLKRLEKNDMNWPCLFGKLSEISQTYYQRLYAIELLQQSSRYYFPNVLNYQCIKPRYFSIFRETDYEYWKHKSFIEGYLGFRLYEDSFNFTESDCLYPMLMAYLCGLRSEFEGKGYLTGIKMYLKLAIYLMKKKGYNKTMMDKAIGQYRTLKGIKKKKQEAEQFATKKLDISPQQLKAMVASIFTDKMVRLKAFFEWALPEENELYEPMKMCLDIIKSCHALKRLKEDDDYKNIYTELQSKYCLGKYRNIVSFEQMLDVIFELSGLSLRNIYLLLNRKSITFNNEKWSGNLSELGIMRLNDPHKIQLGTTIITGR